MSEERKLEYASCLQRMIRIETVSDPGRRSPEEDFDRFRGLLRELFPALFAACVQEDAGGSILLRWRGDVSSALPVMFMNHFDVVPADGKGWTFPPFSGEIDGERLWGRGTLDDKGGVWAMMQAAEELAEEGFVPPRDIYFEIGCDEEIRGHNADAISARFRDQGKRFEMVFDEGGDIVRDPISGAKGLFAMVGVGEKSVVELKFTARSEGGHASTPDKDTPFVRLGKFMAYVDRHQIFDVEISPVVSEMLTRLSPYMKGGGKLLGKAGKAKKPIEMLKPKLGGTVGALLSTTIAFTMAGGGEAVNVIPKEAWAIADMRCSHHQGQDASIAAVTRIAKRFGLETEVITRSVSSDITDHGCRAFKLVEEAVAAVLPEVDACVPYLMTGGSDSRYFGRICDQCIRFLPFVLEAGQLSSIHGVDEYVGLDSLEPAVDYYKYLIKNV